MACSFTFACCLVSLDIQGRHWISSSSDFSSASTIFNMRCLPSAPNVSSTYFCPSASPNESSVSSTQRFHLTWISFCPVNACRILKFASTKGCESHAADPRIRCQLTYVLRLSSDSLSSTALTCLKNSGLETFNEEKLGAATSTK